MSSIPLPQPTGNPILDSPQLKATLAQQMQQQQAPQGAVMPPAGAPQTPTINLVHHVDPQTETPPISKIADLKSLTSQGNEEPPQAISMPPASMPNAQPSLPSVKAPRSTSAGDEAELSRKLSTGSGISQIAGKIENSGLGQAHPVLGKILGIGAQGLAQLGDIGLRTLAPSVDIATPGTSLHHLADIRGDQRQVGEDVANEEKQAQTGEVRARTQALENPADEVTPLATDQGYVGLSKKTGQASPIMVNGEQAQPVDKTKDAAPSVHVLPNGQVISVSRDPKTGVSKADVVYEGDPSVKTEVKQLEKNGKPHQVLINSSTGQEIKDLGETGEKPPVVNVNAGNAALDRESSRFAKTHEKAVNDANAQLEKIADARAMINGSAEAQALGIPKVLTALVSGQGSGVRITQPELNAIGQARGVQGDVQGWLNSVSGKGKLTSQQKGQLTQILDDVQARILQKQGIANGALDRINSAGSREEIIQADKEARQKIGDLEKGGSAASSGKGVSLRDAMALPINKGKSEADVRKDIESHGHTVIQ